MKAWKVLSVLAILALLVIPVSAFAENGGDEEGPWFGDPDPYACNEFEDCWWTTIVCIDGTTYEVGIYEDLLDASPEELAEAALYWTGTVLTAGACPVAEPVLRNFWGIVNPAVDDNICYIFSNGHPWVDDFMRLCFTDNPQWAAGAYVLQGAYGDLYEKNGSDWGYWQGDAAVHAYNPGAKRLPLHAPAGEQDLFDVVEVSPWTQ